MTGLLTSTSTVLPASLNCRFLQIQQISSLSENLSYLDKIGCNENSKIEQKWWVQNLELCNGRAIIQPPAEVLIQTDASAKGWGVTCNGISTGGDVVCSGNEKPHKCLGTFVHKIGYTNILENLKHKPIHLQVDNLVALTYISVKDGATQNLKLVQLEKEIWDHLLQRGINFTTE